jgi:hypothetical protein
MKVGDLVQWTMAESLMGPGVHSGVIIDMLEDENGFYDCEVLFSHGAEWCRDIQLKVINESR